MSSRPAMTNIKSSTPGDAQEAVRDGRRLFMTIHTIQATSCISPAPLNG
jgi:hypothetical protein